MADTPAMTWLLDRLGDDKVPAKVVQADAEHAGFRPGQLDHAKRSLVKDGRLDVERVGGAASAGHWVWARPKKRLGVDAILADVKAAIDEAVDATRPDWEPGDP